MNNIKISKGTVLHSNLIRCLIRLADYFDDFPVSIVDADENSFTLGEADLFEIVKRISKAIEAKDCFIEQYIIYPKSDHIRVFVLPRDIKFEVPGV